MSLSAETEPTRETPAPLVPGTTLTAAELDAWARRRAQRTMLGLFLGGLLLFGGCVAYYSLDSAETGQSASWPVAGDEGVLRMSDRGEVLCADDLETFKRWMNAVAARDDFGMREVSNGGGLFVVPDGTKVKYLEGEAFASAVRVRVLDGPRAGEAVWTSRNVLQTTSR